MGAHATRSASGNKRWLSCPGSIRMSVGRPNNSSEAARLGTAAHGLGEYCLRARRTPQSMLGGLVVLDKHEDAYVCPPDPTKGEQAETAALIKAKGQTYTIDPDMADAVQVYYDAVMEELELREGSELLIEHRSSLNELVGYDWEQEVWETDASYRSPNGMYRDHKGVLRNFDGTESAGPMFGTNDAAVLQLFEHLTIFDYKHGQGVVVEAMEWYDAAGGAGAQVGRGNSQLMQYALGIAIDKGWAFDTLDIVIVQPRARHSEGGVRRYSTDKAELLDFQEALKAGAKAVEQPDAPLAAGSWCQFCPAAGIPCPELHESVIRLAQVDFSDGEPQVATVDEGTPDGKLEAALAVVPLLDVYIKKVREEAMRRLRESPDGTGFGYKLVRGKANRKWGDEATAVEQLVERGFAREELYEAPKLKGPSKVEGLRPKVLLEKLKASGVKAPVSALKALVAEFTVKPEGKIVVASMSDPRDVVAPATAAAGDFDSVEEGE